MKKQSRSNARTGRVHALSEADTIEDPAFGEVVVDQRAVMLRDDYVVPIDDDLAREWDPTGEMENWIDKDPPVDARVPLGTTFCDEFGDRSFPRDAPYYPASGGLLSAFVESRIEAEAELTPSLSGVRLPPFVRPSQRASGGVCRTLPRAKTVSCPIFDEDGVDLMGPEGEPK